MTRVNLVRRISGPGRTETVQQRSGRRITKVTLAPYSWLVYRWTRSLVPGAGWINSYRQEIPETYHRADMRPRLRRTA